jgi:hypothetical protein
MVFTLPVEDIRPTQLLVSAAKYREVIGWLDKEDPEYESLPVLELDGTWYLSDGHTRALALYLTGETELRVERDPAREDLDLALYRECISWCENEGVTAVPDIVGQVVSEEVYRDRWLRRCQRAADRLGRD